MHTVLTFLLAMAITLASSGIARAETRLERIDRTPCAFQLLEPGDNTVRENKRVVVCFARHLGVDVDKALAVAHRESHFNEWAVNTSSGALGLYQHLPEYWPGRVHTYARLLNRYEVEHKTWHNPRANALVAIAMVRADGWWPWGF